MRTATPYPITTRPATILSGSPFPETVSRRGFARAMSLVKDNPLFQNGFHFWLDDNWAIWKRFEEEANHVWSTGRRRYSARTLIEFVRHETALRETHSGYKVNNSFVPDISRLYALLHQEKAGFFECRTMRHGARQRIRS